MSDKSFIELFQHIGRQIRGGITGERGQAHQMSRDLADFYEDTIRPLARDTRIVSNAVLELPIHPVLQGWQLMQPIHETSLFYNDQEVVDAYRRRVEQVTEMTTRELIDGLKFEGPVSLTGITDEQQRASAEAAVRGSEELAEASVQEIVSRMNSNPDAVEEVRQRLEEKSERTKVEMAPMREKQIANLGDAALSGLLDMDLDRIVGGIDRARKILGIFRRKGDGKRVSREPHEYRYCCESNQIQEVLDAIRSAIATGGNALTEAFTTFSSDAQDAVLGDDLNQENFSFGNFVDAPGFRRAIALFRKFRRFAFAANVKSIAKLLGTTRQAIYEDLKRQWTENSIDAQTVLAELSGIFTDTGTADSKQNTTSVSTDTAADDPVSPGESL